MIYIIGVDHKLQANREISKTFINYLKEKVKDLEITFIAEEWSKDASKKWNVTTSTVNDFSQATRIEYRACDISEKEHLQKGIRDMKQIRKDLGLENKVYSNPVGEINIDKLNDDVKADREFSQEQRKREPFWYENIKNKTNENMIFICGLSHISTQNDDQEGFDKLLIEKGCNVQVLRVFKH